ncbi:PorP/SprF family type IX secretion system membrane protein [Deminuibacter soli]|nr:PorP/SprF family type IX secretion system membrane protein [Deminuibacter soli]
MAVAVTMFLLQTSAGVYAQRHTVSPVSQFYRNGFLWNPALAGSNGKTHVYAFLNSGLTGFDGAPRVYGVAADAHFGNYSAAGLQVLSDKAGVLQRYTVTGTYAYQVKLDETQSIRIGANLTYYKQQLDNSAAVNNGQVDPNIKNFNGRGGYFDGDLGVTYENGQLELGATAYNLRSEVQSKQADMDGQGLAQLQCAYTIPLDDEKIMTLKPLVAYKAFQHVSGVVTGAVQFEYNHLFHTSLYWQNPGTIMGGAGVMLEELGELNFFYSNTSRYVHMAQYEVGIKINIQ